MTTSATPARIRLGMVGGGEGAFIGNVHRIAARLDGHYDLVAGAFSSDAARSRRSGAALGLSDERVYADYRTMASSEASRRDGIEAVAIVTPNHLHASVARAFLDAGIHVICDKPLAATLEEALALQALAAQSHRVFCVTYNYCGYAMVRQARAMVAAGELGAIRAVQVEYAQDWLAEAIERSGQKQASWRTDPELAGSGCIGDIGTHAFHLAHFVSGVMPISLCADLATLVPGRAVDDHVQILMRYANGARASLLASQIAIGNDNNLSLRVYGERGGLMWRQEAPDQLQIRQLGAATVTLSRGGAELDEAARSAARIPAGHPEGYLEAFATVYSDAADAIRSAGGGRPGRSATAPTIEDGVAGMRFIDAAQRSFAEGGRWVELGTQDRAA